jgi:colicin import membrane protein
MNQPGVVLRRPVGTDKVFKEDAELPTSLSRDTYRRKPPRSKAKKHATREVAGEDERKAALAYEKEQEKQERERKKQEAAEAKAAERRDKAIAKAKSALEAAEQENEETAAALDAERAALDRREEEQKQRWLERKNKLEAALRRAREG